MAQHSMCLIDGLTKGVCGILLIEAGTGNFAMHTPQSSLSCEDVVPEHSQDAVLLYILGESISTVRHLRDDFRALGEEYHPPRIHHQEGIGAQPVKMLLASSITPLRK